MAKSKTALLTEYMEVKRLASIYEAQEKELRVQIIEAFFPSAGEGTHKDEFKDWEIKGIIRYNYKFDRAQLLENEPLFSDKELACVKRNPEFNLTEYRKLTEDEKILIDQTVVITPGLPSLELKVKETL